VSAVDGSLTQDLVVDLGGSEQATTQQVRSVMTQTVSSVGDGVATIDVRYSEVEVESDLPIEVPDDAASLRASYRMDDRGNVADFQWVNSAAASPPDAVLEPLLVSQVVQGLVLPDEAVGVGAKWSQTVAFEGTAFPLRTRSVVTLVAVTASGFRFEVSGDVALSADEFTLPGVPSDVTSLEADGSGSGDGEYDLSLIVPSFSHRQKVYVSFKYEDDQGAADVMIEVEQWLQTRATRG
jgi:hypothetical protein